MLTPEERAEIVADLHHYPEKRAACMEAMKVVQRRRGWVPDDALVEIAALCEISSTELDAVATFFNQIYRKPVGKHLVLMCDSITCQLMGGEKVQAEVESHLGIRAGGTSTDGEFTMIPTQCLGCCDHAPAFMVDDDTWGDLEPGDVAKVLGEYRGTERPIRGRCRVLSARGGVVEQFVEPSVEGDHR